MTSRDEGTDAIGFMRWLLVVAAVLLVIGLCAHARGAKHHHGDDVGSHGAVAGLHPANA